MRFTARRRAVEGMVLGAVLAQNSVVVMRTAAFHTAFWRFPHAYQCSCHAPRRFPEHEIISKVALKQRQDGSGTAAFTQAPHELAHDSHTGG